jgi:hypothetical protein
MGISSGEQSHLPKKEKIWSKSFPTCFVLSLMNAVSFCIVIWEAENASKGTIHNSMGNLNEYFGGLPVYSCWRWLSIASSRRNNTEPWQTPATKWYCSGIEITKSVRWVCHALNNIKTWPIRKQIKTPCEQNTSWGVDLTEGDVDKLLPLT